MNKFEVILLSQAKRTVVQGNRGVQISLTLPHRIHTLSHIAIGGTPNVKLGQLVVSG